MDYMEEIEQELLKKGFIENEKKIFYLPNEGFYFCRIMKTEKHVLLYPEFYNANYSKLYTELNKPKISEIVKDADSFIKSYNHYCKNKKRKQILEKKLNIEKDF